MSTLTPYAPALEDRESRDRVRRLSRRAAQVDALFRAAVLAIALATLVIGVRGALRTGSRQIASSLDATTGARPAR